MAWQLIEIRCELEAFGALGKTDIFQIPESNPVKGSFFGDIAQKSDRNLITVYFEMIASQQYEIHKILRCDVIKGVEKDKLPIFENHHFYLVSGQVQEQFLPIVGGQF